MFTDAVPSTSDNSAEKNWTTAINVLTVKSPPAGNLRSVGEIQTAGQSTDISVSTGQQHAPGPQTAAVRPQNPAVRPQNPAVSPQSLAPAVQATAQPAAAPKQTIQTGPQAAQHNNPAGPALMSPSKRQNLTLVPGKVSCCSLLGYLCATYSEQGIVMLFGLALRLTDIFCFRDRETTLTPNSKISKSTL